jgi:hypothetical protein
LPSGTGLAIASRVNKAIRISIAIIFAISASTGFAAETGAPQAAASEAWQNEVCDTSSKQLCVLAQGWHWLHIMNPTIDPALKVMAGSTTAYTVAVIATKVYGETAFTQFTITFAGVGFRAGAYALIGSLVVAVVGTVITSAGFFLGGTKSTAPPEKDDIEPRCQAILAPYKTPEGLQRLLQLPPEEREHVLPCIPFDKSLSQLLQDAQRNGPQIGNQIQRN